jgi:hypothetical protein
VIKELSMVPISDLVDPFKNIKGTQNRLNRFLIFTCYNCAKIKFFRLPGHQLRTGFKALLWTLTTITPSNDFVFRGPTLLAVAIKGLKRGLLRFISQRCSQCCVALSEASWSKMREKKPEIFASRLD